MFNGGSSKLRPHKSDVIERLHQIEDQLSAIESTARDVEGDFKSTKKVGRAVQCCLSSLCVGRDMCS